MRLTLTLVERLVDLKGKVITIPNLPDGFYNLKIHLNGEDRYHKRFSRKDVIEMSENISPEAIIYAARSVDKSKRTK